MALIILLLLNSVSSYWRYSAQFPKIDYFCFWAVSQSLEARLIENIYAPDGQKELALEVARLSAVPGTSARQRQVTSAVLRFYDGSLSTTGTPFMLALTGSLSTGNYDRDVATFLIFSFLVFCISILVLCRLLRFSFASTLLALVLFLSWYQPLFSNLRNGNLSAIQLFVVTIFILLFGKSKTTAGTTIAGLVLGLGIMFKPNIVLILALSLTATLLRRDFKKIFRLLAGSSLGIAIALVYSSVFFGGFKIWSQFIESVPNTLNLYTLNQGNFSVINLIHSSTGVDFSVIAMALLIALFFYLTWRSMGRTHQGGGEARTSDRRDERNLHEVFLAAGIGAAIMLVSAWLTWLHYFILVIPLALFMMRPMTVVRQGSGRSTQLRMLSLVAVSMFTPLFMRGTHPTYLCLIVNTAALMILAGAFCEIRRLPQESE